MNRILIGLSALSGLALGAGIAAAEPEAANNDTVQVQVQTEDSQITIAAPGFFLSVLGDAELAGDLDEAFGDVPGQTVIVAGSGATAVNIACDQPEGGSCSSVHLHTDEDGTVDLRITD